MNAALMSLHNIFSLGFYQSLKICPAAKRRTLGVNSSLIFFYLYCTYQPNQYPTMLIFASILKVIATTCPQRDISEKLKLMERNIISFYGNLCHYP